ncbi:MAG: hypothetical protein ACI3ZL_04015 [Candidatus Cryptobacteroides sp.]
MNSADLILSIGLVCLVSSCAFSTEETEPCRNLPCEVGFCAGGPSTRTAICDDGLSSRWTEGDCISVWAVGPGGDNVLDNTHFSLYGMDRNQAFFSATLGSPMPDDTYIYYASYPVPLSVSGTSATFEIPSVQDGRLSSGADILIANPVVYGPLGPVPEILDGSGMSMSMEHLLHQFRFYVPEGSDAFDGEGIEKIELGFPRPVAGILQADYTDPDATPVLTEASSKMTLVLAEPLTESSAGDVRYAVASFMPSSFGEDESFSIKAYTATKFGLAAPVYLQGRTFGRGHSTPVRILIEETHPFCRIVFTVSENNIGEDADSITLTAPEGCVWGDTGSNVYVHSPGYPLTAGETFTLEYETEEDYRAFSGKDVTVTFDCEHVTVSNVVTMPDMSTGYVASISSGLPYLLYEDFSEVGTFNSGDKYSTSNAGDKSATSFLDGWTGGRVGAEEGKCIRIACRRETSADYDARVDSAPIIALKKSADIVVRFDYGSDNEYSSLIFSNGDVGQTVYVGYVTSSDAYSSGSTTGTFEDGNSFYTKQYDGSYDNTPYNDEYVLHSVPAGLVRITWRSEVEHKAGATNTTAWCYIDNVKVQIAQ